MKLADLEDISGIDGSSVNEALAKMLTWQAEHRAACAPAYNALGRLVEVMADMSGQSFLVRGLLYSIWNGHRTDLSNVLRLDWPIRKDFCAVLMAFGYEDGKVKFFYNAIKEAVLRVGLWDWFLLAGKEGRDS